jgi:negative regulator of flagellin synthesis FlgM
MAMANKISGIDGRPVQVGGGAPVSRVRDATAEGKKAETTGAPSNIDVSDTARALAALENKIAGLPVVNESRVEAVRRALDEGRYHVDAQRVADKMMRFEGDLLAAIPAHK